ncbi:MAG TPA: hypothetical protein VFN38_06635 [Gemmatimonadaceae bacterium]|nr:hypothetical protein [Gemmatimonadaceae bacterium]
MSHPPLHSCRPVRALALLCSLALAACGDGSGLLGVSGSADAATVRFVNASASSLDLATAGVVAASNANIAPGSGVACFSVADPVAPGLSVRQSGTSADLTGFAPLLARGGRYTLVAYPGASGFIQFATVPNVSLLVAGRSALRVFNGSSSLGVVDVHVTAPGAALVSPSVTGVGYGAASGTFDVSAGTIQVRLTSSTTAAVLFDSGSLTLEAGKVYTLVVSSATSAALLVPDCI